MALKKASWTLGCIVDDERSRRDCAGRCLSSPAGARYPSRVKRAAPWMMLALAAMGCGGASGGKIASAAIGAGLAVAAAAINRAATKDCWAMCAQGMRCDRASGLCVPSPERPVSMNDGPTQSEIPPLEQGDAPLLPDCRGLCFRGEECIARAGVPECVPVADAGPPDGG
jgi:hypothetical protein